MNQLEKTNTTAATYASVNSRYLDSIVYYYGEDKKIAYETYKRKDIPETSTDRYLILNFAYQWRPDRLAHAAYGNKNLWWKIMEANNIHDIYDFKAGLQIRLPGDIA